MDSADHRAGPIATGTKLADPGFAVEARAVREAIKSLGPSRTGEAVGAARRGDGKVAAWLPVASSAECSEALRQFSSLATRLDVH